MSRNARSAGGTGELEETAKVSGCDLQFHNCDISDETSLLRLLEELRATMPPIRGVVTGAMVLDVSLF